LLQRGRPGRTASNIDSVGSEHKFPLGHAQSATNGHTPDGLQGSRLPAIRLAWFQISDHGFPHAPGKRTGVVPPDRCRVGGLLRRRRHSTNRLRRWQSEAPTWPPIGPRCQADRSGPVLERRPRLLVRFETVDCGSALVIEIAQIPVLRLPTDTDLLEFGDRVEAAPDPQSFWQIEGRAESCPGNSTGSSSNSRSKPCQRSRDGRQADESCSSG
jgi:hypothetical protein